MAQPNVEPHLGPGVIVAGKYRILAEIGRGGMGAVYLAHHAGLDQKIAIKVMGSSHGPEVARFVREARAAARLTTEHVARVTDVGTAEGIGPYIAMEYLTGADLGRVLEAQGAMPIADAVDAVNEAAEALAEAHAAGIVHRDLKPSNLFLVQRPDRAGLVKVLDFGISKMMNLTEETPKLTETRTLIGSPHYMSPEQLRSAHDVDARADIWSLGVVLYELLTQRTPFDGHTVGAVFANVLERTAAPLRLLRPDTPPEIELAVARCLRRDPAERFQHVGHLALALAPFGSSRARAAADRAASTRPPGALAPTPAPSSGAVLPVTPGPSSGPVLPVTPGPSSGPVLPVTPAPQPATLLATPTWNARPRAQARVVAIVSALLTASIAALAAVFFFFGHARHVAPPIAQPAAPVEELAVPEAPLLPAAPPPTTNAGVSSSASAAPPRVVRPAPPATPRPSPPASATAQQPDLDRRR